MKEIFANFQKYDEKGRRMNLFAEVLGEDLLITFFPCSKKDQFSKEIGWVLFKHKEVLLTTNESMAFVAIPIVDNKPKKTFLNWCNDNFYHLRECTVRYNRLFLENKNNKRIILKDNPMCDKLSMY